MEKLKKEKLNNGYLLTLNGKEYQKFVYSSTKLEDEISDYAYLNWHNSVKKEIKRIMNKFYFDQYVIKYNFDIVKTHNNIIEFEYNNNTYYYIEVSNKFRMKGQKMNEHITIRQVLDNSLITIIESHYIMTFGKYVGHTLKYIAINDVKYAVWLLTLTNVDPLLIKNLKKELASLEKQK